MKTGIMPSLKNKRKQIELGLPFLNLSLSSFFFLIQAFKYFYLSLMRTKELFWILNRINFDIIFSWTSL